MAFRNRWATTFTLLLAAACAGVQKPAAPAVQHQADERAPTLQAFPPGDQRVVFNEALVHEQRGWMADSAGNSAEKQKEFGEAAKAYLAFLQRFPGTGWDVTLRYHAADLLARAKRPGEVIPLTEQVAADPSASSKSRAMAWLLAANALVDEGKLEALRIVSAADRKGAPPAPREPPGAWKRFLDAADGYLQAAQTAPPEPTDRLMSSAQLAAVAAQVAFAVDDMPGARRRLELVLDRWPGEAQVFQNAAPLYVETFLVAGDREAALTAAEHVQQIAQTQVQQATSADARAAYEKVVADEQRLVAGLRFDDAKALLEQGKAAEAAQAFEALAQESGADTPAALNGAAIAWDRSGDTEKASRLRARILAEFPQSWVAPGAALQLAADLSKKGDHAEAGRVYGEHADRWPDDANHCTALRNGAIELDLAKQFVNAAQRYEAFGSDAKCAEAAPDAASLSLFRAGQLFLASKRRDDARRAFQAAIEVKGVKKAETKRRIGEAKRELRRLGRP